MERSMTKKILATISLLMLSGFTYAVEEDLGTIKVTEVRGNKDEKTFAQSNESISILKPKNLNRGDIQNSIQMLNGFANVQTQSDRAGDTFSIRGISDMGVTGVQKDNLASILVDDVFQTTLAVRAGSFENWDLEAVEIHRGSQSTTQGVNSLAGNILLYHYRPQYENGGDAKLTLGNYGRKEAAAVINHAINDKFAVRFSYNKEYTDGYITNTYDDNDKWGQKNKDHFVSDFLYRLSSSEELRLNVKLLRMHRGGSYVQEDFKEYEVTENHDYKELTNNQQLSLVHTKKINNTFSNKVIVGATRGDSTTTSDEDGTAGPVSDAGTRDVNDKDSFVSIEEQFKYRSERVRNLVGFHFHRYHLNNYYNQNLLLTPTVAVPTVQENDKVRNTYAIFDTFSYDLNPHHTIDVGGRFEVVKNDIMVNIKAAPPLSSFTTKQEDSNTNTVVLPKLGYNYHYGNYSLGASYNEGYRTGGISVNRSKRTTSDYDPERTNNYELSWKYMENRLLLAANAFYTKWKDQQVEVILSNAAFDTQIMNAAESELYGAEFEGSYLLANADSVRLNAGYVHTQFLSFNSASRSYTGNEFPDAANVTGQLSYWKVINDSWRIIFVERYVGESFTNPENDRHAPEQFYSDINGQYNFDQFMLELYMRNIFNQKYRLLNGSPRSSTTPYQASYNRMSAPQEFGARLNYFW
jgi:iron complex outermembrane receptor protein